MAQQISEDQICRQLGINRATLREWAEHGLIEPPPGEDQWSFEPVQVRRIWSIVSLQRDLEVNLEGIAVILDLCDRLRNATATLAHAAQALERGRRRDEHHLAVLNQQIGPMEWDIDV
jgi:DNA-binding transcriptional MerR regulator